MGAKPVCLWRSARRAGVEVRIGKGSEHGATTATLPVGPRRRRRRRRPRTHGLAPHSAFGYIPPSVIVRRLRDHLGISHAEASTAATAPRSAAQRDPSCRTTGPASCTGSRGKGMRPSSSGRRAWFSFRESSSAGRARKGGREGGRAHRLGTAWSKPNLAKVSSGTPPYLNSASMSSP